MLRPVSGRWTSDARWGCQFSKDQRHSHLPELHMPDTWAHVTHIRQLHLMADLAAHSLHSGWASWPVGPELTSTGPDVSQLSPILLRLTPPHPSPS